MRTALLLIFLLIAAGANSQFSSIKVGTMLSTVRYVDGGIYPPSGSTDYRYLSGFGLGYSFDEPIANNLCIKSGIELNAIGYRTVYVSSFGGSTISVDTGVRMYYLNFPLQLKMYLGNENVKFIGGFGGYYGVGVGGDVTWGKDYDFKRSDLGVTPTVGIHLKHLFFEGSYSIGLRNIRSVNPNEDKFYNRVINFSIGYRFGELKMNLFDGAN